jgi:hypothetical protein
MQASHCFCITIFGTLCWYRWYIFRYWWWSGNYKLKFRSSLQVYYMVIFKAHHLLYLFHNILILLDAACLRQYVTSPSPQRSRFDPRPVHVGFGEDKVALRQDFLQALRFSHRYHSTNPPYSSFSCHWHIISTTDTVIKQHTPYSTLFQATYHWVVLQTHGLWIWYEIQTPQTMTLFVHCTLSWENLMLAHCSRQTISHLLTPPHTMLSSEACKAHYSIGK